MTDLMKQQPLAGMNAPTLRTFTVVFDGGSLGNPGRGYGSYKLFDAGGELFHEELSYEARGNRVTNNEAEYLTLIAALGRLAEILGERASTADVSILGDSMLVVNQLAGSWKVKKPELRPLHAEALAGLRRFGRYRLQWHDRSNSVRLLGH